MNFNYTLIVGFVQAAAALWRPFEAEFGDFQNELQKQNRHVCEEIDLAFQQAHRQEQLLQAMEREAASRYRLSSNLFRRRVKLDSDEARHWRLQANERQSSWSCLLNLLWILCQPCFRREKRTFTQISFFLRLQDGIQTSLSKAI